jgi:hypothetical protein
MKRNLVLLVLLPLFQLCSTRPQTDEKACFTGKLVKRGICGQRVVQLIGQPDGGMAIAQNWTDSLSHKAYENVFTVGNSCNFPSTIKEGDEFTFTMTTQPDSDCAQCMAYTPVPEQKNSVIVGCTK